MRCHAIGHSGNEERRPVEGPAHAAAATGHHDGGLNLAVMRSFSGWWRYCDGIPGRWNITRARNQAPDGIGAIGSTGNEGGSLSGPQALAVGFDGEGSRGKGIGDAEREGEEHERALNGRWHGFMIGTRFLEPDQAVRSTAG